MALEHVLNILITLATCVIAFHAVVNYLSQKRRDKEINEILLSMTTAIILSNNKTFGEKELISREFKQLKDALK